jgi:hypothetical protein
MISGSYACCRPERGDIGETNSEWRINLRIQGIEEGIAEKGYSWIILMPKEKRFKKYDEAPFVISLYL